jgi:8-hydroxy-5-deazaflavin:NADPH oxidoreductase
MRIGVLGTGMVGNTIATKLVEGGHEVMMGSRTRDNDKAVGWARKAGERASQGAFEDVAQFGEVLFNCTSGTKSLAALEQAGADALGNRILIDLSNPLSFVPGELPTLTVMNTDSLGEQIQRTFPQLRVVKTLNAEHAPHGEPGRASRRSQHLHERKRCGGENESRWLAE